MKRRHLHEPGCVARVGTLLARTRLGGSSLLARLSQADRAKFHTQGSLLVAPRLTKSLLVARRSICTRGFNHRLKNFGEVGEADDGLEFPWKCLHIAASLSLGEQALDYCCYFLLIFSNCLCWIRYHVDSFRRETDVHSSVVSPLVIFC